MTHHLSLTARAGKLEKLISQTEFSQRSSVILSLPEGIRRVFNLLVQAGAKKRRVFLIGNGGSSAVASHALTDFTNVAGLNASTLHESSLITCLSNDYGYENAYARALSCCAARGDLLVAISSSGRSKNILNAASQMRRTKGVVITLTGFDRNNPLKKLGDLNAWVDSRDYGLVEIAHLFILHHLADYFGSGRKKSAKK